MTLVLFAALALVQDTSALFAEGTRYLEEWNLRQAERVFRELAALDPGDARASYYLGVALARCDVGCRSLGGRHRAVLTIRTVSREGCGIPVSRPRRRGSAPST